MPCSFAVKPCRTVGMTNETNVSTNAELYVIAMKPFVGRGHVPAACRNYQVRTNLFIPTVCRFAVGGDMSPPYRGCFVYRGAFFACGLRGAQRRGNLFPLQCYN